MKQKFGNWLGNKLLQLDMKPADVVRASHGALDSGVLSNLINNKRHPSVETCKLLASTMAIPLEEVYTAADVLPEDREADATTKAVTSLMSGLPSSEKEEILNYVRFRHRQQSHNKAIRSGTASRTASA